MSLQLNDLKTNFLDKVKVAAIALPLTLGSAFQAQADGAYPEAATIEKLKEHSCTVDQPVYWMSEKLANSRIVKKRLNPDQIVTGKGDHKTILIAFLGGVHQQEFSPGETLDIARAGKNLEESYSHYKSGGSRYLSQDSHARSIENKIKGDYSLDDACDTGD
ncbi:hypothetical protein [Oceanobacter antarcticus]|uniref:Uncharacterized protein n=1 Tax=Oceanobacter antarcticus TaxID=3133425 RepID=A0ABW8NDQ7_9GAMM